jgi:hypothetical protein
MVNSCGVIESLLKLRLHIALKLSEFLTISNFQNKTDFGNWNISNQSLLILLASAAAPNAPNEYRFYNNQAPSKKGYYLYSKLFSSEIFHHLIFVIQQMSHVWESLDFVHIKEKHRTLHETLTDHSSGKIQSNCFQWRISEKAEVGFHKEFEIII